MEHLLQSLDMVLPARQTQNQGFRMHIHDLGMEEAGDIGQFLRIWGVGALTLIMVSSQLTSGASSRFTTLITSIRWLS